MGLVYPKKKSNSSAPGPQYLSYAEFYDSNILIGPQEGSNVPLSGKPASQRRDRAISY